jgi:hypothetical protein
MRIVAFSPDLRSNTRPFLRHPNASDPAYDAFDAKKREGADLVVAPEREELMETRPFFNEWRFYWMSGHRDVGGSWLLIQQY